MLPSLGHEKVVDTYLLDTAWCSLLASARSLPSATTYKPSRLYSMAHHNAVHLPTRILCWHVDTPYQAP